jgi:arginine N-succinyltransferase
LAGTLIRDIAPEDLDDFQRAAVHLDSVNLPDDRGALAQIIERSRRSFAAAASGASEPAPKDRCFVFVAADRDSGEVAGTSMIFPQHGSRKAPHVYFDVLEEERYSETLDRHFVHRVLRIGYNYKGLTEVGGLVVRPEFRRHPERLGRLLMSVRFLYIARHRPAFRDEVLSELMPPLEPDGTSLLWESLGRRFTGLSYQEADRLSQENKEFIRTLFPQDPLYASLLPAHVQELIGQVGPDTKAVERMLKEIGFAYAHRIDPFDGGPHFHARTDDITLVRATRAARVAVAPEGTAAPGGAGVPVIVARERAEPPYFMAARAVVPAESLPEALPAGEVGTLPLAAEVRDALRVASGDEIAYLRLSR